MGERERVGLLGLGLMGRPMASVLGEAGWPLTAWNRSRLVPELTEGIVVAGSLEDVAAADLLLLVLFDSESVGEVVAGLEPWLRPGQLVIDATTSRPRDSVERAARLGERGVGWVDAPISGGPPGVVERSLAIMAGGEAEHVERARPLLEALGRVTHVGGPGAGHTAKLVNQAICGLYVEAVAEGMALAERAGLDIGLTREAMLGGAADSRVFRIHGGRMIERDFEPRAEARVMLKDLTLVAELADELGLDLPHVASTKALYEQLGAGGGAALDVSALYTLRLPGA